MKIKSLEIKNIRNINHKKIDFKNNNVIIGENATGKTTIAECIYYCCFYKSFRTNKIEDLTTFNTTDSYIKLTYTDEIRENLIEIYFYEGNKKYFFNKKEVKDLLEIVNKINCIIVQPNNIDLIENSPLKRRKYLNILLSQLDISYLKIFVQYNKLLKIKKNLLKTYYETNKIDLTYLEVINKKLFIYDQEIKKKRKEIIQILEEKINENLNYITDNKETIKIAYQEFNEKKSNEEIVEQEIKRKKILKGNHLDDFEFMLNNKNTKNFASQGQKRLLTLLFFLVQRDLKGANTLIIFDDVSIDLDKNRQQKLLETLKNINQNIYIITDILKVFIKEEEDINLINMP